MTLASSPPGTPHAFAEVMSAEETYTRAWRTRTGRSDQAPLSGLALSGGGIRSAVFCLGVLQALAKRDLLKRFDYLSTVSGGGYIGASLTWFTRPGQDKYGVGPQNLPYGIDDPQAPSPVGTALLGYLRRHGSYLAPGGGLQVLPGISVVLRGLVLNLLLIWLPIATVLFVLLRALYRPLSQATVDHWHMRLEPWMFPAALASVFVMLAVVYSIFSGARALLKADTPYAARRLFERIAPGVLGSLVVLGMLASLPYVHRLLHAEILTEGVIGTIMTIGGAALGLWARLVPRGRAAAKIPAWVGPVGAPLVMYGMSLLSYAVSVRWFPSVEAFPPGLGWLFWPYGPVTVLLACLVIGYVADLNETTLHRFYRDRLMEAFMPDKQFVVQGSAAAGQLKARQADPARLHDMCRDGDPHAPYHLINAHLVLTRSDVREFPQPAEFPMNTGSPAGAAFLDAKGFPKGAAFATAWSNKCRIRGGDSFAFAPKYCGSAATGWYETATTPALKELSLPTAMAASGAAVNPDAANAGVGPQRSWSFAVLMSLLNIRLGYWLANPKNHHRFSSFPNHFVPGLTEAVDHLSLSSKFLQITDGGHFDNLGVYELLRRGVETIVVCDGTADPVPAFADLQNLVARAEADFGVTIQFAPPPLKALMPSAPLQPQFPLGVAFAKDPFVVGDIHYPSGRVGKLFYIKPVIFDGLRLSLLGFKGAFPKFPDDSTVNQFFSEARFEAYRELGFACASRMLADQGVTSALATM